MHSVLAMVVSVMSLVTTPGRDDESASGMVPCKTGQQTGTELKMAEATPLSGQTVYVDPTYGFSIGYPNGFVVQPQDVSKLAHFTPTPVASIFFMSPTMARGDLAGIEPPDLEVRVYQVGTVDSLKSWLVSVGFASGDSGAVAKPYRNANVNGLEVCQSTMIAPGCSIYVLHDSRVYQLTAISREGEAMIDTFALLPR